MMKKFLLFSIVLLVIITGFLFAESDGKDMRIKITINEHTIYGYLNNSATAEFLVKKLPLTLPMQNLYSREMVYSFPNALPTDNVQYTGYEVGEIIYWPPRHSFVIMYAQNGERFSMQKVGVIESDLNFFNSMGTVDVTIELVEE